MADETNEIIAVSKVAKTVGKAIDTSSRFGQWLDRIFGDLVENGVGLASDRLKYYRLDQLNKIHEKFEAKWKARCLDQTRPLPTGVAIKVLEEATVEENDDLQELWANLLVNAMNPEFEGTLERSYVSILAELSVMDTLLFDRIAKAFIGMKTNTPKTLVIYREQILERQSQFRDIHLSEDDIDESLRNIHRLGLIRPGAQKIHAGHDGQFLRETYMDLDMFGFTVLGRRFYSIVS